MRAFLHGEAVGGVLLLLVSALALVVANLPVSRTGYVDLLHLVTGPVLSPAIGPMTLHLWINDGLMTFFFLLVGLEVKRELAIGSLADPAGRRLPLIAAAGGMIAPALFYLAVAGGDMTLRRGWAIPAATDIAFAIGVLALVGRAAPPALRLLLATIAIADDLGAVLVIAFGYTDRLFVGGLAGAAVALAVLYVLHRRGVSAAWPYLAVGAVLWLFVLGSGVHATIAGVLTAMAVPVAAGGGARPLDRLEHALRPWVTYAVVPLFAFANAGVPLDGLGMATFADPLVPAVAGGLFLGKQAGVFAAIRIAEGCGFARRPPGIGWWQVYGLALAAGIGFTMSLFIGGLAFPGDGARMEAVKIGVFAGSLLSGICGLAVLLLADRREARTAR